MKEVESEIERRGKVWEKGQENLVHSNGNSKTWQEERKQEKQESIFYVRINLVF